jgi:hypothetical protein
VIDADEDANDKFNATDPPAAAEPEATLNEAVWAKTTLPFKSTRMIEVRRLLKSGLYINICEPCRDKLPSVVDL